MVAAGIVQTFLDIAPEYSTEYGVDPDRIDRFLTRAQDSVNEGLATELYQEAVANLAAHNLYQTDTSSDGSEVTERQVDNARERYAGFSASKDRDVMDETKWGRRYKQILQIGWTKDFDNWWIV